MAEALCKLRLFLPRITQCRGQISASRLLHLKTEKRSLSFKGVQRQTSASTFSLPPVFSLSNNNGERFALRQFHSSAWLSSPTIPFKLSDIGEGIKEVTIKEWFVKEGDKVNQFDQICEVQSDKASVTITSRYDGVIKKVHYAVDDIAQVGAPLVDIEVVETGERSAETEEVIQERDAIQVGRSSPEESFSLPQASDKVLATPAVRRIASEYKIELNKVQGTGKDGRVLKEDVLNHINAKQVDRGRLEIGGQVQRQSQSQQTSPSPVQRQATKAPTEKSEEEGTGRAAVLTLQRRNVTPGSETKDRSETIKGYTRTMIKTMTAANEIPHFGYSDEINVTQLISLRRRLKKIAEQYDIKLTMLSLFMKSASLALSQFPILNASLDLPNNSIIYKGSHNIGVAMDTKNGLIVPNVKNVESKSILEIAQDLQALHKCAISGSVKPDDLRGGTFSISNIGSIGGTYAHPVILPPEVAIVALGKVQSVPRFGPDGEVVRQEVVNVSFSCDHRVIDGATAARFSNLWKDYIEDPSKMLLYLQ